MFHKTDQKSAYNAENVSQNVTKNATQEGMQLALKKDVSLQC